MVLKRVKVGGSRRILAREYGILRERIRRPAKAALTISEMC